MADQARQRHRHAETRVVTHRGEVRGQPCLLAGDAEIGDQSEAEAGADGAALHCGNNRFFGQHQALRFVIEVARRGYLLLACGLVVNAFFQVGAGAEMFARSGQHDRAHLAVAVQRFQRGGQFADQFDIEEVVGRAAQFHRRDMAFDNDADFRFAHGLFRGLLECSGLE